MKNDQLRYLEQFYHDEVDITHHIDFFEAERLIDYYRQKWIKRNEAISERAPESED